MSRAKEERLWYQKMIAIGDEAIARGIGGELLSGDRAEEAATVARRFEKTVIDLETAEGIRWNGDGWDLL